MDIHGYDYHAGRRERMRERIAAEGIDSLQPHEVIEFLLYYMVPRQDVNAQAHRLTETFGGVRGVLNATTEALVGQGLSRRCAEWLRAVGDVARTIREVDASEDVFIRSLDDALAYGNALYGNNPPPGTFQICVDAAGRVIFRREITPSRSWGGADVLRDAVADVLACRAHGVLIVQLLPRERAIPEAYDIEAARVYAGALRAARCELWDVLLIGVEGSTSLRALGRLPDGECAGGEEHIREVPEEREPGLCAYARSLPVESDKTVK